MSEHSKDAYTPTAHDLALISEVEHRRAEHERKLQADAWDAGASWCHRASGAHTNERPWLQNSHPEVPQFAKNPYRGATA